MGHLPNKRRKEREAEERRAHQPAQPPAGLPRCTCGLTWHDTELVSVEAELFCRDCAPDNILAIVWPDPEIDCMCNDYAREIEAAKVISYMEEMKDVPPFEYLGGRIPNDIEPQPHVRIHDKGFILRLREDKLVGSMTRWAWEQGKRPVYNFKSEGRDFSNSDRCLIAATAFYEYTDPAPATPKAKLKDQHRFTMKGQPFFWVAGIVKEECFTMLTTAPGADIKPYHDRQIVVLPPAAGMAWLRLGAPESGLLAPAPRGTLRHEMTRRNGLELDGTL